MDINTQKTVTDNNTGSSNISHFFKKEIQEKIQQHPCYSKEAHQYARIHLAVAPACNIQCHYCNRKYDCSNESRPGVVSTLVDPASAVKKYQAVKKRLPELSVMGIAGPGDALANPNATFATLKAIKQTDPDVQLCISTNGLALPDYVDELKKVGVEHLTITINCIDPQVGSKIYPWVYFNHQRLYGIEASSVLIQRQLEGLKAASQAGMLVKINTVLIPGINDHHIQDVAKKVKEYGAMLHNIMPLISEPEHGTYFGLNGQRGPDKQELEQARQIAGIDMPQMTHCQQCRADAVGRLDHSGCSSDPQIPPAGAKDNPVKHRVAIASKGSDIIDSHFGHAESFDIYDISHDDIRFIASRDIAQYCTGTSECAEEDEKAAVFAAIADCNEVLCTRMGIVPWRQLEKRHIQPNIDLAFQPVAAALAQIAARIKQTNPASRQAQGE